jgi:type I restriction enzyme S subunit
MSRIDELIAELCPRGVESKALGEVGAIMRGRRFVKADVVESGTPCIHYGELYTKYETWATKTFSHLRPEMASRLRFARPGDVIFVSAGETVEDIGKSVAWLGGEDVVVHDALYAFRSPLDPKYVAYFSQTDDFHSQIRQSISSSKVSAISPENLGRVRIPIPPIEIQRDIARILDGFTELEAELAAELEAELEARRRQYKYYRDALLGFAENPDMRWAALGEIGTFIRGRRFTKADYVDDGIDVIHYGEIYTHYSTSADKAISHVRPELSPQLRYAQPGDVIVTDVGETVEDVGKPVAWLGAGEVAIHDHCYAFRHTMNPKFVSYCMQTARFSAEKRKYVARTKVNTLLMKGFAKICIPVPPPEEQARIVAILDKLDALVNDLSISLPAELAARRKQYEHYRDRLLTFREAA